jgi:hypothetical protein
MLNLYLIRAGVVTGPLSKNTSHSSLEVIKKYMLGLPQFKGGEQYLLFGSACHELLLEGKITDNYRKLSKEEQQRVQAMVKKALANALVKTLMANSIREQKIKHSLNGVEVAVVLDCEQSNKRRAFDYKTTGCTSQREFEKKAKALGYPRQGETYVIARNLKEFFFIGQCVNPPHDIYVINHHLDKDARLYAQYELQFLLYFYRNYGKIIGEVASQQPATQTTIKIEDMTGKEQISAIKEALAEHKAAAKVAKETRAKVLKLMSKFPKKEQELYSEQLQSLDAALEKITASIV